ncbi:hypothetical protein K438DRAFT_1925713 [Mycena galopus ATCC 62051]|nr:hypothetical protein K438DRAFT_1925713 [Mycena galopus ATCC 62051]
MFLVELGMILRRNKLYGQTLCSNENFNYHLPNKTKNLKSQNQGGKIPHMVEPGSRGDEDARNFHELHVPELQLPLMPPGGIEHSTSLQELVREIQPQHGQRGILISSPYAGSGTSSLRQSIMEFGNERLVWSKSIKLQYPGVRAALVTSSVRLK